MILIVQCVPACSYDTEHSAGMRACRYDTGPFVVRWSGNTADNQSTLFNPASLHALARMTHDLGGLHKIIVGLNLAVSHHAGWPGWAGLVSPLGFSTNEAWDLAPCMPKPWDS